MKVFKAATLLAGLAASAFGEQANPLGKVLDLIDELAAKVTKDGEAEAKAYKEYFDWCDDTSKNADFAIETAAKQKEKLEAQIGKLTSNIQVATENIEELAASIAQSESELKNATQIRDKEAADFAASEKELMEVGDAVGRAIGILEKEMAKNSAALTQVDTTDMSSVIKALGLVLDAASFPSSDQKKLVAFAQSRQDDSEEDSELGAPAGDVYKSKSGGIVEVLEDMKDKAETELSDLRKAENNAKHNYEMLKQSLEDQVAADSKDMANEKAAKAAAQEEKATAESDLENTKKDLANSQGQLDTAHGTCMQTAADHEATVASRTEELKVIAQAKQILEETSKGAVSQSYSLVQVASSMRLQTHADLARSEVITMVKRLAKQHHSAALAQLASRIAAAVKLGDSPFGKVKGLISDMIAKLEKEANEEAEEKAYCDEQMSKTEAKKGELDEDMSKMTAKIDKAAAKSAELEEQIKELQGELAALSKEQAEMDKIRSESHADFETAKADLELGLSGVRGALQVLREYYGSGSALLQDSSNFQAFMQQPAMPEKHSKAGGAGSSIIAILETCESDFATNLAKEENEEADAQSDYEKVSQENKVTKTTKEEDVKYKTQESKSLDTTSSEITSDRETTNTELAAVNEYFAKVKDRCVAKPESYEERERRREAEVAGLKEALSVLEDETALVQRKRRGSFRGTLSAQ